MNPSSLRNTTPAWLMVLLLSVAGCNGSTDGSNGASPGGSGSSSDEPTVPPPAATGSATLSWRAPTQNEDGTALTNLAGYRVRYGRSATALNSLREIRNPATTTVSIHGLTTGTWYFTLSAYTNSGVESDHTTPVSKTIG